MPDESLAHSVADEAKRTDAAVANNDLDSVGVRSTGDSPVSLRWIMVHLVEELARHAGHADILREQIDGSVGR